MGENCSNLSGVSRSTHVLWEVRRCLITIRLLKDTFVTELLCGRGKCSLAVTFVILPIFLMSFQCYSLLYKWLIGIIGNMGVHFSILGLHRPIYNLDNSVIYIYQYT